MIADDKTRAKIFRLSLKSFVSERDDFVLNTLINFEQWRDLRTGEM